MRSALVGKELRELTASRAALVVLMLLGPLVGQAFITAVQSYAEASGSAGGAAALAQALSPLDGIVVPTFGAYAIASTLLLPFVAIRLASSEKESGALALLLQGRASLAAMLGAKLAVLTLAWAAAWIPGLTALLLWRGYGGHLHAPEVFAVLGGHLLRALLVSAIALAAAAVADGAASAAVIALAVTLGTWALDFVASVKDGAWQAAARFTPESALRTFERGEPRLDVIAVTLVVVVALFGVAIVWMHPGRARSRRLVATLGIAVACGVLVPAASTLRASWDLSEDRRNSLAESDGRALAAVRTPLAIEAHLAPEDPRLADLQRGVWHKLARALPDVRVRTVSATTSGLFEPAGGGYGEVWYTLGARRRRQRSSTEPIVLETVYELAGIARPTSDAPTYTGYPLVVRPRWAAPLFYLLWPLTILLLWLLPRRAAR